MKRYKDEISMMEKINEQNRKEKLSKLPKPFLLKRVWAGLLDIIFIVILAIGFEFVFSKTILNFSGFNSLIDETKEMYLDSNLYIQSENNSYIEYQKGDNLNEIIIHYYENDEYAKNMDCLDKYNESKINSSLFEYDNNGNIIEKLDIEKDKLDEFYYNEYQKAIDVFDSNGYYQNLLTRISSLFILTLLLAITLATSIIYLIIPLCRKNGETPAQIINNLCIVDNKSMVDIKKRQIVIRYLVILLFNYFFPILMYVKFSYFSTITILISVIMICVTKNNIGPHDYLSQSVVILKRKNDVLEMLNSLKQN